MVNECSIQSEIVTVALGTRVEVKCFFAPPPGNSTHQCINQYSTTSPLFSEQSISATFLSIYNLQYCNCVHTAIWPKFHRYILHYNMRRNVLSTVTSVSAFHHSRYPKYPMIIQFHQNRTITFYCSCVH